MSSTDMNPFDETGTENLDMEDPPADTALAQQDLADSGSDHPAEAADSAQVSRQQAQGQNLWDTMPVNNPLYPAAAENNSPNVPRVASNSYPGLQPQSNTQPAQGSAGVPI